MRLTQLAGDCFLIETNQGAVLALLKQNMGSDLFSDRGDLLSQISRIHDLKALIVSPQVDFSDPLIGEVMEQFPKARILLLGTEGKRLQSSNARNIEFDRVHHLPAFQFLRVHPLLFMGVPICWGGKSEGFILCWQDKQIWFQWPSPPNPEVMLATRVFCGHPITAAYVPVMEGNTANHPHDDSIWIQAALGARAQEIHLSGP